MTFTDILIDPWTGDEIIGIVIISPSLKAEEQTDG